MGCGSSNQVHVVGDPAANGPGDGRKNRKKIGSTRKDADSGSVTSLDRGGSATSKASRHSGDSGFDDEEELRQRDALLRRPLPLSSGTQKERVEEKKVLETLQEEGLIPIGRGAFGAVSFQVMTEFDGTQLRRPPPRLAKLETRKKKKKALTQEEIQEKLERAERRRKEVEQQRLNKIQSMHRADGSGAAASTDPSQPPPRDDGAGDELPQAAPSKTREEIVAENRERKLREKLDKLRAKEAHAELVRRRKLAALVASMDAAGEEIACNEAEL